MTFEIFPRPKKGKARRDPLLVTIGKSGTVSISAATWDLIGKPTAVRVLVDRQQRTLRLEPGDADDYRLYGKASQRQAHLAAALLALGWVPGPLFHVTATEVDGGLQMHVSRPVEVAA